MVTHTMARMTANFMVTVKLYWSLRPNSDSTVMETSQAILIYPYKRSKKTFETYCYL